MPAIPVVLDANIFDLLAGNLGAQSSIRSKIDSDSIELLVTPTVMKQLNASPFKGVPSWLPLRRISESVALCNGPCDSRIGRGTVMHLHQGPSKQWEDALIADVAATEDAVLVTEDRRLLRRLSEVTTRARGMRFEEFLRFLADL